MRLFISLSTLLTLACSSLIAQTAQNPEKKEPNKGGAIDLSSADPAIQQQRFRLAPGYEINLFASEIEFPDMGKPIGMAWDDKGRLWLSTMPSYPHVLPGEAPNDKIVILEDKDHDGAADDCKVFADGLYLPTGFELGDGGVYVGLQPNVEFMQDTNGDDRMDTREIILHGFGTEDSHHAVHAFNWGPDGGLYFGEGVFLNTQVETPSGPVRLKDGGWFRYEPTTKAFGVFVSYTFANPWGQAWDQWGTNFIADASGGANYFGSAISGRMEFPDKHTDLKVFTTVVRPTCGCELVASRHFPDDAQGIFLLNNTIGFQGTKQHRPFEEGSGYNSKEEAPLLESSDPNFRPVAIRFGPDGALYIVDWWNPLIGHMQYSMRDQRRDVKRGRVWRITAKGRPLVKPPVIAGANIAEKLELLKLPEDRTRYRTRISLREHPRAEVGSGLTKWKATLDTNAPEYERLLLEALWVSQTVGEPDLALLKQLLRAKNSNVRSGATRALRFCIDRGIPSTEALSLLADQINDETPRVRLEAVLTLSFIPNPQAAELVLNVLKKPTDYYLDYVTKDAIAVLAPQWKATLFEGAPIAADNPKGVSYLLKQLSNADLTSLAASKIHPSANSLLWKEVLLRGGIAPTLRTQALSHLADPKTSTLELLIGAIATAQGDAKRDLAQMLADWDSKATGAPKDLPVYRREIVKLTTNQDPTIRKAALIALIQADGKIDQVWTEVSKDKARLSELLDALTMLKSQSLLAQLYAPVSQLGNELLKSPAPPTAAPVGRFVRLEVVGTTKSLSLAELEIYSAGENIALKGRATQKNTAYNAPAALAIDGKTDGAFAAGTTAHTMENGPYPWWEVDLGAMTPVERIVIWNRTDGEFWKRMGNFKITLLDSKRDVIWEKAEQPAPEGNVTFELAPPNLDASLRRALIDALTRIPGKQPDASAMLSSFLQKSILPSRVMLALTKLEASAHSQVTKGALAPMVTNWLAEQPADQRDGKDFQAIQELARTFAAAAPNSAELISRVNATTVLVVPMKTLEAQMKYDVNTFYVAAGQAVKVDFQNPDVMQHNLVFVRPGAREEVGKAADSMGGEGFKQHFIPESQKAAILANTLLVEPKGRTTLQFTAPQEPGEYPFLCTFIGHWPIMHGMMIVVPVGDAKAGTIERP